MTWRNDTVKSSVPALLSLLFGLSPAVYAAPSGAQENHNNIGISTCEGLQQMQRDLDASYHLLGNIDCTETRDWNDGAGFRGVHEFTGEFHGNGYVIRGLYINRAHPMDGIPNNPNHRHAGLFGKIIGAKIHGAKLENVNITGPARAAGLVVEMTGGSLIEDSYVTGFIYRTTDIDEGAIGGLVAVASDGKIRRSYFNGTVNGGTSLGGSGPFAGGLVGYQNALDASSSSTFAIEDSYATGSVSTVGGMAGGLMGHSLKAHIRQSFSNVAVISDKEAGGLVGHAKASIINNSYAVGSVTSLKQSVAGGLIGIASSLHGQVEIKNAYAAAGLTANTVGGLVAELVEDHNLIVITSSYWDRQVAGTDVSAGGGTSKTTVNMKKEATYIDWNFDKIWEISEGISYPTLLNTPSSAK